MAFNLKGPTFEGSIKTLIIAAAFIVLFAQIFNVNQLISNLSGSTSDWSAVVKNIDDGKSIWNNVIRVILVGMAVFIAVKMVGDSWNKKTFVKYAVVGVGVYFLWVYLLAPLGVVPPIGQTAAVFQSMVAPQSLVMP